MAAWNSADSSRIARAIDQVCATACTSVSAADAERIELLQDIACGIREWLEGRKSEADLEACLKLLAHLVGSRAALSLRGVSQLEARAFVRQ